MNTETSLLSLLGATPALVEEFATDEQSHSIWQAISFRAKDGVPLGLSNEDTGLVLSDSFPQLSQRSKYALTA